MCHFLGRVLGCAYTIFSVITFKFFAYFPVDHLACPVVSRLIIIIIIITEGYMNLSDDI